MEEHDRLLIFFHESFKVKESSLQEMWNADTAFLLGGADIHMYTLKMGWLPLESIKVAHAGWKKEKKKRKAAIPFMPTVMLCLGSGNLFLDSQWFGP